MDSEDSTRFLLCHPSFQVGYNKLSFLFAYHDFSPAFSDFPYYITSSFVAAYFCGIAIGFADMLFSGTESFAAGAFPMVDAQGADDVAGDV
jgi:hypothetical protein